MFFRSKAASRDPGPPPPRAERLSTAILSTELGPVLDVSRTGFRISMTRKPGFAIGSELSITLESARDALTLTVRVARVRHIGSGRYEVGMSLVSPDAQQQSAVERLARTGSARSAAGPDAFTRERLIAALRAPDHYAVLGIAPSADPDQVREAFRALARRLHPDVNKAPDAEQSFATVNEAYSVLVDPQQRAEYDAVYALRRSA